MPARSITKLTHDATNGTTTWTMPARTPNRLAIAAWGVLRAQPLDCRDEDLREWKIVEYGIKQLQTKRDQPLLLTIGLHKPHLPWNVPRKYFDMHPLDKIELPPVKVDDLADVPPAGVQLARPQGDHADILASGRWREAVQAYLAAISYADAMIGQLIDALDRSGHLATIPSWCCGAIMAGTWAKSSIGGNLLCGKKRRGLRSSGACRA